MSFEKEVKRLYTTVVILSPVLSVYGVSKSHNTFTIREVFIIITLILCFFCLLCKGRYRVTKIQLVSFLFVLELGLSFLINTIAGYSGFEFRIIRYAMLFVFTFFMAHVFFDYDYGVKIYRFVTVFASIYVIAQVVSANFFSYALKGYLSFLPIRSQNLIEANFLRRYYSIFEEPGYYGMFASGYLIISLFSKRKEVSIILLVAVASLLTTSTTAIVTLVFTFGVFLFSKTKKVDFRKYKWEKKLKLIVVILGVLAAFIFVNSPQYSTVIYRLTKETSTADRFVGYNTFFEDFSSISCMQKLFGNAMQEYSISGYAAIVLAFGIIGTTIILLIMVICFFNTHKIGKLLLLLFMFINIGNVEFLGNASTMLVYFGFILSAQSPSVGN